jgi:hypothetical protein
VLMGGVDRSFRLTEEYLANHLGISKSPVREALKRQTPLLRAGGSQTSPAMPWHSPRAWA